VNIKIVIDEKIIRQLVFEHISEKMRYNIEPDDVLIEVKSKQNYKSEWEVAAFRATVDKNL
jgi:hypothetical protein